MLECSAGQVTESRAETKLVGILRRLGYQVLLCFAVSSCAPSAQRPAEHGGKPPAQAASKRPGLAPAPAAVAMLPERCKEFLEAPTHSQCSSDHGEILEELDHALSLTESKARDRALALIEHCGDFPRGYVRALRAELIPGFCGDALVESELVSEVAQASLRVDIEDVLRGIGIAARLDRISFDAPRPPTGELSKAQFLDFFKTVLAPFISERALAIQELSQQGSRLRGYGRGIAAIAAGAADLRFVEFSRAVPLPPEMERDPEIKDAYYGALDEALEPRKARGRDAALVGLKEYYNVGILKSARLEQARSLLSRLYSGRRVDLLDSLLLPPLPPLQTQNVVVRLLAKLPTYYVSDAFPELNASGPDVLRSLLEQGLPPRARVRLRGTTLMPESREYSARLHFELGRTYWVASEFAECAVQAVSKEVANEGSSPALSLIGALATALQNGPSDAAQMMMAGPALPGKRSDVARLDQLSLPGVPFNGLAAFDAAYVLSLNPPAEQVPQFWLDVAKRYHAAAEQLSDPKLRKEAMERERAALETAKVLIPAAPATGPEQRQKAP